MGTQPDRYPPDRLDFIVLEEARRSIDTQIAALDELRSRAGVLTASASLLVSFLGSQALSRSGWTALSALALIAFLATLGLTASIMWPRGDWRFEVDVGILLEDFNTPSREDGITPARHLAGSLAKARRANDVKLKGLYRSVQLALVCLGVQAVLWAIQLASTAA